MEVHAPNPFLTSPFCCLEIPLPTSWKPSLTYLEIPPLCRGANSHPLWSQVGCILTPPPHSPAPLSPSQRFPLLNRCPLETTLRYRLHIVRYRYHFLPLVIFIRHHLQEKFVKNYTAKYNFYSCLNSYYDIRVSA
jgi:hypothetical protein